MLCSTYNNDDSREMRMPKTSMTKIKTNVLAWMYIKYSYNFVYFSFFPFYLFIPPKNQLIDSIMTKKNDDDG